MAEHETDVTSLVFGVLFLGLAAVWALVEAELLSAPDASAVLPVLLIAAGALGLALSVRRARRSQRSERSERSEQPTD